MKRTLFILCLLLPAILGWAQYEKQWGIRQKGYQNMIINKISTLSTGDYVMFGSFSDSANFSANKLYSSGGTDILLLQIDEDGNTKQAVSFGTTDDDKPVGMMTKENKLFVLSSSKSQLSLQSLDEDLKQQSLLEFPIEGKVNADMLIAKTDRILIGGSLKGKLTIGNLNIESMREEHAFLVAITKSGEPISTWQSAGTGAHRLHAITNDADGGHTLVVNLGKGTFEAPDLQPTIMKKDGILLLKLDSMMRTLWIQTIECTGFIEATSIVQLSDGNCMAINFGGTLTFGEKSFTATSQLSSLLIKLKQNGQPLWATEINDDDYCRVLDLVTSKQMVICTGYHYGQLNIGNETFSKANETNTFLLVFNNKGLLESHIDIDCIEPNWGRTLTADSVSIVVGGMSQESFASDKSGLVSQLRIEGIFARKYNRQENKNDNSENNMQEHSNNGILDAQNSDDHAKTDLSAVTLQTYPNPVQSILYWSINEANDWQLMFYDIEGRLLAQQQYKNTNSGSLDLIHCIAGVYLLKLSANNVTHQCLIIKN